MRLFHLFNPQTGQKNRSDPPGRGEDFETAVVAYHGTPPNLCSDPPGRGEDFETSSISGLLTKIFIGSDPPGRGEDFETFFIKAVVAYHGVVLIRPAGERILRQTNLIFIFIFFLRSDPPGRGEDFETLNISVHFFLLFWF